VKVIPSGLLTHYAKSVLTVAHALRIDRADAEVYAFTEHDEPVELNEIEYEASQGLMVSNIVSAVGTSVGNLELSTLHDGSLFTEADLLGGRWKNAKFFIFRYNYEEPEDGIEPVLSGVFGEPELEMNKVKVELRDLRQYLQQEIGSRSTKTCRYRLGDSRCRKAISGSPWTVTGTLTSAASNQVFRDSARTEDEDYFGNGIFTFTSGANEGLSMPIKSYDADGTFTLVLPMMDDVVGNETYAAVVGCRKRLEDCKKFDNVLNFGGQPHRPGVDQLTSPPVVNV
jgi:uncharacterized phage protein (TIGR02218 family)